MTKIHPTCPTCKDRGWIQAPYYSHGMPRVEPGPCPDCCGENQHVRPSSGELAFLVLCFAFLLAMVAKGFPVAS